MAERLTDQNELSVKPDDLDFLHLVDVSDTGDNAAGSSKKIQVRNLLKGRTLQYILGCLVFKPNASPSTTTIQPDDWIIYMNSSEDRIVLGLCKTALTTIPSDFDDNTKFLKFHDGNSLLP